MPIGFIDDVVVHATAGAFTVVVVVVAAAGIFCTHHIGLVAILYVCYSPMFVCVWKILLHCLFFLWQKRETGVRVQVLLLAYRRVRHALRTRQSVSNGICQYTPILIRTSQSTGQNVLSINLITYT